MAAETLVEAPKFQRWKKELSSHGVDLHGVEEIHTLHRHNGEVLFSLVSVDARTQEGDKLPGLCFLKGMVVSVLVCLIDEATGEKFLLLIRQRRLCNGEELLEQVAGMVDGDDQPLNAATREVIEEVGLAVNPEDLVLLNEKPYFPSSGTSDEAMYFYYVEKTMGREEIFQYDGRQMGVISEHERIITTVMTIPQALATMTNANGLLVIYKYLHAVGDFQPLKASF